MRAMIIDGNDNMPMLCEVVTAYTDDTVYVDVADETDPRAYYVGSALVLETVKAGDIYIVMSNNDITNAMKSLLCNDSVDLRPYAEYTFVYPDEQDLWRVEKISAKLID